MRKFALLGIVAMALCLLPFSATAITIGFSPASQTVEVGDTVLVDVVISDLAGEIVSAYDLDVTYDASILSATDVTFGTFLGDEFFFEVFNDFDLSVPGVVDFAQLSLLSDFELAALQPDSFVASGDRVRQAIGDLGTSSLDFRVRRVQLHHRDCDARPSIDVDPASGSVQRGPGAALGARLRPWGADRRGVRFT